MTGNSSRCLLFFFQAEDGIRDHCVTGVQTCALPIFEREFDLDLLVTAPNVAYRAREKNGEWIEVHNPAEFPREIEDVEEPYVTASIIVRSEERRVGKECRCRWARAPEGKKRVRPQAS